MHLELVPGNEILSIKAKRVFTQLLWPFLVPRGCTDNAYLEWPLPILLLQKHKAMIHLVITKQTYVHTESLK